jgi:hypothetical protein
MWNEQINGLATNHSPAPLHEQEWMQAPDVEEMELSSKIDLKNVLWWKSIKNACRFEASIIVKLSKEGCLSLAARRKPSRVGRKQDTKYTLRKV